MKYGSYLMVLFVLSSCKKEDTKSCFEDFKAISSCEIAKIDEYLFQSKTVFVLDGQSCVPDGGSEVVDDNCMILGVLGTIAGNTKINGEEFSNAIFVKNIWTR